MNSTSAGLLLVAPVAALALAACSPADTTPSDTSSSDMASNVATETSSAPAAQTEAASEAPSEAAPETTVAEEPTKAAVEAPEPKGPWEPGSPVPMASANGADIVMPDAVGSRTSDGAVDGVALYQENGAGSIGTIAIEEQPISFYLQTMQNPVDYGDFVCAEGTAWGGGPACLIGLADDSTLSFQNSAGPDGSVEGSAQFAAEALSKMKVK